MHIFNFSRLDLRQIILKIKKFYKMLENNRILEKVGVIRRIKRKKLRAFSKIRKKSRNIIGFFVTIRKKGLFRLFFPTLNREKRLFLRLKEVSKSSQLFHGSFNGKIALDIDSRPVKIIFDRTHLISSILNLEEFSFFVKVMEKLVLFISKWKND